METLTQKQESSNLTSEVFEKKKFSNYTLSLISDLVFDRDSPLATQKDVVKLAVYANTEQFPIKEYKIRFYARWISEFIDQVYHDSKDLQERHRRSQRVHISKEGRKLINQLFELKDIVYLKSDILHLYEAIEMATEGYKREEKEGVFMLLTWLND